MTSVYTDIFLVSENPRRLGGNPSVINIDQVNAEQINTNILDDNGDGSIDSRDIRLNTTIGGDTYGAASGLATLDATGKVPVSQIPDAITGGLDAKASCRVKTAAALPAYTAAGSEVGKTLTANANGVLPAIDGITLLVADRVLVDQVGSASDVDNGIYTVTDLGSGATPWILTRATDADETGEISAGTYTFVSEGNTQSSSGFVVSTDNPITVDTTPIQWSLFSTSVVGMTTPDNTYIGQNTLPNLTSGTNNSSLGFNTFNALTTGSDNTAVGDNALALITTGNQNTAIGSNALANTAAGTTGLTAVGYQALLNATTGTGNVAFGSTAGRSITTGSRNTALGFISLFSVVGADDNTAGGYASATSIDTGARNTAFGSYALTACTSGSDNTAIGKDALQALVTGSSNTAVGHRSLEAQTGSFSTAFGDLALLVCQGNSNAALGRSAGGTITTGTGNTIIGTSADTSASAAIDRIAVGRGAVVTANYSGQIGESTVSPGGVATLKFRSQTIADEAWVGTGVANAAIDNSGNIIKGAVTGTPTDHISATAPTPGPAAPASPSASTQTTFITTTGTSGAATGTLADGTLDGQVKYLVAVSIASGTTYDLDVSTSTDLVDANGTTVTTMRFDSTGNSAAIVWNNTTTVWYIIGAGVTLI